MKLFEIIFILLLLLPVAALMRYFIKKLSIQTPKQGRPASRAKAADPEKGNSVLKYFKRKKREAETLDPDGETTEEQGPVSARPPDRDYEPERKPASLKRTERIPFSEIYGEAARQEAARKQAAGREAERRDAARQEYARQAIARQEYARQELARQELARQEAARRAAAVKNVNTGASGKPSRSSRKSLRAKTTYIEKSAITERLAQSQADRPADTDRKPARDGRNPAAEEGAGAPKKPLRSEKMPTKRQIRKNRQKSRKRSLDRREKEAEKNKNT